MLQVCVNGVRRPSEHPALPVTPAELAADVAAVAAGGADAVHLHVKDDHGADTLDADALAATLAAVRAVEPALPIGVTTGAWALPDAGRRVEAIRSWRRDLLPDFASVNWHEEGAAHVAAALLQRGIGVEAGLWHVEAGRAWSTWPRRNDCLRVLLELPNGLGPAEVDGETQRLLDVLPDGACPPLLLHGEGSSTWPALRSAGRLGLATRIGLEDVLLLPDGSPAPDNAALLRAAQAVLPSREDLSARAGLPTPPDLTGEAPASSARTPLL